MFHNNKSELKTTAKKINRNEILSQCRNHHELRQHTQPQSSNHKNVRINRLTECARGLLLLNTLFRFALYINKGMRCACVCVYEGDVSALVTSESYIGSRF